ncbi:MAG: Asp/Glu racemase [Rhizobacter sp.]|nr:Asp/Glu racemase [Rhizobacter sp.]
MRLLVINPNTTTSMTEAVVAQVRGLVGPEVDVIGATAASGSPVIASRETFAIGAEAAVRTLETFVDAAVRATGASDDPSGDQRGTPETAFDGVMLACFGDPGLAAMRQRTSRPVEALAEAAVRAAVVRGERFAIVTAGTAWVDMLSERVNEIGATSSLVGVYALPGTGRELAADPIGYRAAVEQAARRAADAGAQALILGGAAFAGQVHRIDPRLRVIDPVVEATRALVIRMNERHSRLPG